MYGQGNYGPQYGQGPSGAPMPLFQQRLPPPFQQGLPPAPPPHAGVPGVPMYPPPIQQSYLPPPPPVHGSTPAVHSYPSAQQNSQYPSHLGTQNPHPMPPRLLPPPPFGPMRPDMLRPPPPPSVLPPPPSQAQMMCRASVHPLPTGGVQGLQHIMPPTPPPPSSNFFSSVPVGSFAHSIPGDSHMPSMAPPPPPPPPPPSSPPPIPPSPPPPTSPLLPGTSFSMPHHSDSAPSYNRLCGPEITMNQIKDDGCEHDDISNQEGGNGYGDSTLLENGSRSKESVILNLPPPPPRPTDERIVKKIEVLCQFIAKNGPDFEDRARQNESGNPEFEFLFGGEPGSEVAIAHEYFLWMKKKCILAVKLHEGHKQRDSQLRRLEMESLLQPEQLMDPVGSHLAADSDMEMEDDITQPAKDEVVYQSLEGQTCEHNEPNVREQLDPSGIAAEHITYNDAPVGDISCSGSSRLSRQRKDNDSSTLGTSVSEVHCSVPNSGGTAECHLDSNNEKSTTTLLDDSIPSRTLAAASGISSENFPGQVIKGASPFRLLQDYASDDSTENGDMACVEDVSPVTLSPSVKADTNSLHREIKYNPDSGSGSKNPCMIDERFGQPPESTVASISMSDKAPNSSPDSLMDLKEVKTSIASGTIGEHNVTHGNQASLDHGASYKDVQEKGAGADIVPASKKSQIQAPSLKIDEFGRLVKEGASDSDSDDSHYTRRRSKRGRSRSRSLTPPDRRRRRRSPLRRKEKRSRSRSWSPNKRRSRSKSPAFRRLGEYSGDKMKRDRGQMPACFDFLRGRCYRGASCRYLHHDSGNRDGSRRHKNKEQYLEEPPNASNIDFCEGNKSIAVKISLHEHHENKNQLVQLCHKTSDGSFGATKDGDIDDKREEDSRGSMQGTVSDQDGKSGSYREPATQMLEMQEVQEGSVKVATHDLDNENFQGPEKTHQPFSVDRFPSEPVTDADALNLDGDASATTNSAIQKSHASLSIPALHSAAHESQQVDGSAISGSSPDRMPIAFSNKLPVSGPYPNKISQNPLFPGASSTSQPFSTDGFSSQSLAQKELSSPGFSAVDYPHHPSQLPPPPPPIQGVNAPHLPQPQRDYNSMPQTTNFPFQPASGESFSPYQASLSSQHSHFSVPPNSSWTPMLPPPPRPSYFNDSTVNQVTVTPGVQSQYQQNHPLPRNNFVSQSFVTSYPTELPTHSQLGEFQHLAYPPMQEPHQPPLNMELKPLHVGNSSSQQFGGSSLNREDSLSQFPVQGLIPSSSFAQSSMYTQPVPFVRGSPAQKMQPLPGEDLPPGEILKLSSQIHPIPQQRQPSYGLPHSTSDSVSVHLGVSGKASSSMSRYSSDVLDGNQASRLSDFGGSRISAHYNPYASTFEQPLSSKFSSNLFRQDKDTPYGNKYDTSFSLSHDPIDKQGVGSLASRPRQTMSSPNSASNVRQILPRSGGDQYDPLFDSIEPASNSFRKYDLQKLEPVVDSDMMLRLDGSHKPLDVEENNKQKEVEAVAITTSLENDEYGETADAVGAVENGSPSSPIDVENIAAGEIEIDQIKSPGKSKKSKDSRSMKVFKIALAEFVKEVLKPSWRQGNMSKEAFKTIVKKTVDKVSGAMKSHQIPKSQAKINHFIDSSQRKLTKLVMGYVDKYVKA